MVKIQKLPTGQLIITIPKRLAELKGWDKGMDLVFRENDMDSFILAVKDKAPEDEPNDKKESPKKAKSKNA